MDNLSTESVREALRPITSLLVKSEKACQKLRPGTWQRTMLERNISALQVASRLLSEEGTVAASELHVALPALADMAARTAKVLSKFEPGTSQNTLQRNRLNALKIAEALVRRGIEGIKV